MKQMEHELKIFPWYFSAVVAGQKKTELRKNDRSFNVGDYLILKEYSPDTERYTGAVIRVKITHILQHASGLMDGYVILSFEG